MSRKLMIKVCGMRDEDNIQALVQLPINYIGFIFYSKSSRFVELPTVVDIPKYIKKTGVFVNENLTSILQIASAYQLNAIQLHGGESPQLCQSLKDEGFEIIKAFGLDDNFDWKTVLPYQNHVDYFLFDTKSTSHGGTGQTFNWQKLKENPTEMNYFLSGGLSIENLEQARSFEDYRLKGLDLNSKFEIEPGLKDIEKLKKALSIIS